MAGTKKNDMGIVKSVMTAYLILALHILLIFGIGIVILFFRGFITYMLWVFLGGTGLILISALFFYRRLKKEGKNMREMMKTPLFRGKSVEVSIMGGMASIKLDAKDSMGPPILDIGPSTGQKQLESGESMRIRQLTDLAYLLEKELITRDEYEAEKSKIMGY